MSILICRVYYTTSKEELYISDDLLEVGKRNNRNLYDQAVYEFLLTEANVGKESVFEKVFRLGFGKQLSKIMTDRMGIKL